MARAIGTITLEGDKELVKALGELGGKIERKFRRTAASQTMRVLRTKARDAAPNIKSKSDKSSNLRQAIKSKVNAKAGRPVEGHVFVNYDDSKGKSARWAHFFEGGTKRRTVKTGPYAGRDVGRIQAYKFMTQTFERNRRYAINFFQRLLRQQVEAHAKTAGGKTKFTGKGKDFRAGKFVEAV